MKLLIITQAIDERDPVLGFFHGWIAEFAKNCESIIAVGLSLGTHDLPKNVQVFSLGKERFSTIYELRSTSLLPRLRYLWNFYRLIFRERKNYDAVFVHMNPEYVLLGGIPWKLMGKRIGLWYTHKNVDWRLRLAVHGADVIFTASPESFRMKTPKCHVVGHGIDTARFRGIKRLSGGTFRICSIGRLSKTKGYGVLLRALQLLKNEGISLALEIIGGAVTEKDKTYLVELKTEIARRGLGDIVTLLGGVPNNEIMAHLAKTDLFVNMSQTGSLDKAVLEAMAAGVPVLTSNEGLRTTLAGFEQTCMFKEGDEKDLAVHIRALMSMAEGERNTLGEKLRSVVEGSHDLRTLIPRIVGLFRSPR